MVNILLLVMLQMQHCGSVSSLCAVHHLTMKIAQIIENVKKILLMM